MNIHEHVFWSRYILNITHKHENKWKGYIYIFPSLGKKKYIYIGKVIYYVALLIDNEHHSHSLEFLSEPELSLYTCRAVGSCLLHILFVLRVFLLPTRLWGQEWHIVAKGVREPTLPTRSGFTQLFGYLWRGVSRKKAHINTMFYI